MAKKAQEKRIEAGGEREKGATKWPQVTQKMAKVVTMKTSSCLAPASYSPCRFAARARGAHLQPTTPQGASCLSGGDLLLRRRRVNGNGIGKVDEKRLLFRVGSSQGKINPSTGLPIEDSDVVQKKEVTINGTTWAYRCTEGAQDESDKTKKKPAVVLLHGILSSSYSYRAMIQIMGQAGYRVVAPDWPGHGLSSAPGEKFTFKEDDYLHSLKAFLHKLQVDESPYVLVTQGFILGQYGLLYALKNKDDIEKLVMFNTPLLKKTPLPPVLKSVKGSDGIFGFFAQKNEGPLEEIRADNYMQGGSPYYLDGQDATVYQEPFEKQEYRDAVQSLMNLVDYEDLVDRIDQGFRTWRKESLVAFGTSDFYVDWNTASEWLEDKRTNIRFFTFSDKMGHSVQDDYPERVAETTINFIEGEDIQRKGKITRTGDVT